MKTVQNVSKMGGLSIHRLFILWLGSGNSLQYSCLENPMDKGARQATVHGVSKSWTQLKWLSTQNKTVCMFSVMSNSLWPHGLSPARLLCPWNSPGKNTGVGCHFCLQNLCILNKLQTPHSKILRLLWSYPKWTSNQLLFYSTSRILESNETELTVLFKIPILFPSLLHPCSF